MDFEGNWQAFLTYAVNVSRSAHYVGANFRPESCLILNKLTWKYMWRRWETRSSPQWLSGRSTTSRHILSSISVQSVEALHHCITSQPASVSENVSIDIFINLCFLVSEQKEEQLCVAASIDTSVGLLAPSHRTLSAIWCLSGDQHTTRWVLNP